MGLSGRDQVGDTHSQNFATSSKHKMSYLEGGERLFFRNYKQTFMHLDCVSWSRKMQIGATWSNCGQTDVTLGDALVADWNEITFTARRDESASA